MNSATLDMLPPYLSLFLCLSLSLAASLSVSHLFPQKFHQLELPCACVCMCICNCLCVSCICVCVCVFFSFLYFYITAFDCWAGLQGHSGRCWFHPPPLPSGYCVQCVQIKKKKMKIHTHTYIHAAITRPRTRSDTAHEQDLPPRGRSFSWARYRSYTDVRCVYDIWTSITARAICMVLHVKNGAWTHTYTHIHIYIHRCVD